MEPIGRTVKGELSRFGAALDVAALVEAWPAAVGESIARNAWPARVARDGTLHVATSSSSWAFELGQLEAQLLEGLKRELGTGVPPRLRFAVGPLPEPDSASPSSTARPGRPPTEAERRTAAELAAPIGDGDLRQAVAEAAAASIARAADNRPIW